MYMFSLQWVEAIFSQSVEVSQLDRRVSERCRLIINHFKAALFTQVAAVVTMPERLVVALALSNALELTSGGITAQELSALANGPPPITHSDEQGVEAQASSTSARSSNATASCGFTSTGDHRVPLATRHAALALSQLPRFEGLVAAMQSGADAWAAILAAAQPHLSPMPRPYHEQAGPFKARFA